MSVRPDDEDYESERRQSLVDEDRADHAEREDEDEPEMIRAKWLMDDATTLVEAAERLEAEAKRLRQLADEGWTLDGPIDDDYGTLVRP